MTAESITCPDCGRTSWHPEDVRQGYCGYCHDFTAREPVEFFNWALSTREVADLYAGRVSADELRDRHAMEAKER